VLAFHRSRKTTPNEEPLSVLQIINSRFVKTEAKKDSIDVHELLQELEKLKEENDHLKKAVGNMAITNVILKTANDVLKKNQRSEKLKPRKKLSKFLSQLVQEV
jgi:FtsZ-binding cell division protein ZapB